KSEARSAVALLAAFVTRNVGASCKAIRAVRQGMLSARTGLPRRSRPRNDERWRGYRRGVLRAPATQSAA
ncbi:MAG: hypothetical protein LBC37_02815, partial [Zoogloeaceae bacterium]|nr:hypothetical protein [Zoogloeaceae bacterium]